MYAQIRAIRPILEYASPVYDPVSGSLTLYIESIQRRASKLVFARTTQSLRDLPFLNRYFQVNTSTLSVGDSLLI